MRSSSSGHIECNFTRSPATTSTGTLHSSHHEEMPPLFIDAALVNRIPPTQTFAEFSAFPEQDADFRVEGEVDPKGRSTPSP